MESSAKNPVNVCKVKQLVCDLELGLEVEAALLLMNVAELSELLADETHLRRRLGALADSTQRAEKILWIIKISDESIHDLLEVGVKIWAKKCMDLDY